ISKQVWFKCGTKISNLQRDSSQVLCHSLSERDLEIANLKKEGEKLRRNQALTTGLVTSLQRDISAKEQRILQLKLSADKVKKENREKDNQIWALGISKALNYFSQLFYTEIRIVVKNVSLHLLSHSFQVKMGMSSLFCAFISSSPFIPFCQLMEKIKQITDENLQIHEEEKLLQEEINSKASEEKEVSESVAVLKKSLDEFQAFLKTSYCSSSLKREICNIQDLCIDPSVLWIHAPVIEILSSLLSWVEAMEHLLQDVGIDMSCSDKGSWFSFSYLMCNFFSIY
uniref:Uncharacterized protein n=1 Tax=Chelydra serpentina TaxID=8475 RepID=A0A8C3ST61_CHESE